MKNLTATQFVKSSINGAYAALFSSVIIIIGSVAVSVYNYNQVSTIPLMMSTLIYAWYVFMFLLPKYFTTKSKNGSIEIKLEKLKKYVANRSKYETWVMAIWMVTLIPFLLDYYGGGTIKVVVVGVVLGAVLLAGTGALMAFEKQIASLSRSNSYD